MPTSLFSFVLWPYTKNVVVNLLPVQNLFPYSVIPHSKVNIDFTFDPVLNVLVDRQPHCFEDFSANVVVVRQDVVKTTIRSGQTADVGAGQVPADHHDQLGGQIRERHLFYKESRSIMSDLYCIN